MNSNLDYDINSLPAALRAEMRMEQRRASSGASLMYALAKHPEGTIFDINDMVYAYHEHNKRVFKRQTITATAAQLTASGHLHRVEMGRYKVTKKGFDNYRTESAT
tara:strand:+ start:571 stop:888 length:318 start_codon:yes stop_codon:yes gene_type:complete